MSSEHNSQFQCVYPHAHKFVRGLRLGTIMLFWTMAISAQSPTPAFETPYSPSNRPRMVAEWEPAVGVLIGWPLALPYKLVLQLAADTRLHVMVSSRQAMQSAIKAFTRWGIMPNQVKFILADRGPDYFWTRDWGPHGLFVDSGGYRLVDADYSLSTPLTGQACTDTFEYIYRDDNGRVIPVTADDRAPQEIGATLGQDAVRVPFAFTGGNVLADGQRTAFSTCALANENNVKGLPEEEFRKRVRQFLGIEHYYLLSNFERRGIQHIDCFMKLLDEERLLVLRLPEDHPDYAQYEGIVTHELRGLTNAYGRPYEILRIDTDRYDGDECAAYTNALILNTTIYVPLFGIPQDARAIDQWQAAMPGYKVLGFTYVLAQEPDVDTAVTNVYDRIGWKAHDALHCRTRAIWDPAMIYLSVDRVKAHVTRAKDYVVNAIVKDYEAQGAAAVEAVLRWRVLGESVWKSQPMKATDWPDVYAAKIPGNQAGVTLEYYVEVTSSSGKTARMPRTSPDVSYSFSIE